MKKVSIRQLDDPLLESGELGEKIGRLRVLTHPHVPEVHDFGFYDRVYRWVARHPLGDQMRRWIAVTEEGEVVGHLSALPQYYRIGGRRIVAHTPGDYEVNPGYGFYALSLMRAFFRATENCVACDILPAVISVETRLGAEEVGRLDYTAKLLNVSKLPVPALPGRLFSRRQEQEEPRAVRPRLSLPGPVQGILNGGLRAADEALGGAFGRGPKAEVLEGFDEPFDALFETVAAAVSCTPEKDAAFLRWRYGPGSPQHPVTVLGVKGAGGELLGYTVLKVTTGGIDGYVLDLTTRPGRRDVARALLRGAVRFFRDAGTHLIRYRYKESPISARSGDLRLLGFFYRKSRRNSLLVGFADTRLHETARRFSNWAYTIGDGEPTFWMR